MQLQKKLVEQAHEEKDVFQKQTEKLIKKMKEQSDSESADQMDASVKIIELQQMIKTQEKRIKGKDLEWKVEVETIRGNLESLQS